ncbi:hypothetical protein C358_02394 [Cryptococcus neoformans MW-RSA852]|nr:hypothetical protein C358_02394 [Cryptococcus neoformans var. grubii MW-RSA852]
MFQEQVIALRTLLCGQSAFLHLNKVFLLEAAMNNEAYLEEVLDGFKYSLKSYMVFSDGSSGGLLVRTMATSTFKKWLDPAKRLPLGNTGKAARAFLGSINACFSCRKTGHHQLICPTRPPSSPPQHSSSAPAANLISLADDDSPDAPGIFLVDPIADQLVQDGATTLAGSVPLLGTTHHWIR